MAETATPWQHVMEAMTEKFGYLLTSGHGSDCSFIVGSDPDTNQTVVPAHKIILAMASPVFEAMFYGALKEAKEQIVSVPDVQPEVFRALLQYIYTGNIDIATFDMAWNICYVAKKYILPNLVKECIGYILSVLGPSNVCQAYEFARFYDEETLTDLCIQIISRNTKEVLNDTSFEDIELDTLLTVLSLDHLNVDSELDLIDAVARYAEAEKKRHKLISPMDIELLSEKVSELKLEPPTHKENALLPIVESGSQTSSAAELDPTQEATEMDTSEPIEGKFKEDKPKIRAAIEKIRFLSLTPQQFAEGAARSGLLTEAESFAVLLNIASRDSAVPMPTGFSECRDRRQQSTDDDDVENQRNIKGKSNYKLPVNPSTQGVSATTLINAAEIVQGLTSSDLNALTNAVRVVRKLFTEINVQPRTTAHLLKEGGIIPPLVAALDHPSSVIQLNATRALEGITAGTRENTLAVFEAGAVPKLVALIGHGGAVAAEATKTLGNIAWEGPDGRDAILNHGALQAMLPYMHRNTPIKQLRFYVWTYLNLCRHNNPKVSFELVSPALPNISELLNLTDSELLADACSALMKISLLPSDEYLEALQAVPGLTQRVVALLRYPAPQVKNHALSVLTNMLSGTDVQTDRCLDAGCLDHIIELLQSSSDELVKDAALATSRILDGTHTQIQKALDKQILDPLLKVLLERNDTCKYQAAWAIYRLCAKGTTLQLDVLLSAGVLEPYCNLLSTPEIALTVLDGIRYLLQRVTEQTRVELCRRMRELGVPELLTTLIFDHEDEKVRNCASHISLTLIVIKHESLISK